MKQTIFARNKGYEIVRICYGGQCAILFFMMCIISQILLIKNN